MDVDPDLIRAACGTMTTMAAAMGRCEYHWREFIKGFKAAQHEPPKLCIDGHEYHRRQRRRTKGKRR